MASLAISPAHRPFLPLWTQEIRSKAGQQGFFPQPVKAEREEAVACIDRVLRIAQQMGEAKLTGGTMAGLRGVAVRHPDLWPVAVEEVRDHRGGSARHDDVANRRRAQQHPLPPGL